MTASVLPNHWQLSAQAPRRARSRQLPFVPVLLLVVLLVTVACGGSDGGNGDADAAEDGDGGGSANVAQQLFTAKGCAECHGAEGEGVDGQPNTPLMGTRLIIQQFETRVRNGKGSAMPGATEAEISDEEIRTIFDWLSGR